MSTLIDKLTISGGGESVDFLNDIVAQLWPNINVAGSRMTKEIAEPMFQKMLPGPLSSLHFVKLDLGPVPIRFSNVDVHKTDHQGIKVDMDLDWDGRCDIELDGQLIPKIGVEHVKLQGRLSVLLCPLTNIIPLIGAAQVAFINPPTLQLDFTDAANIADCDLIDDCIRKVILNIISSMAVFPNRFLVKLDASNDYFKTYQYQLGVLRLTMEKASGFADPKKGRFLTRLMRDAPDCYCKVTVAAEEEWRTSTKKNATSPEWNEVHDFLVTDYDQCIMVEVHDEDFGGDDHLGNALTSVKQILLTGGRDELTLTKNGEETPARLSLSCQFYELVPDIASFSDPSNRGHGKICGLATVLIASAFGIQGHRTQLTPSVRVTWGDKTFNTPEKRDAPGTDISNPSFDSAFRIPITADTVDAPPNFRITLVNKSQELGSVDVPFADVLAAPDMILQDKLVVGEGTTVRSSICIRGIKHAST